MTRRRTKRPSDEPKYWWKRIQTDRTGTYDLGDRYQTDAEAREWANARNAHPSAKQKEAGMTFRTEKCDP